MAPMHLAAYYENLDAAAAFNALSAITDQVLQTAATSIRVPPLNNIIMAAAGADGVVDPRVRLESPSLDRFIRPEISPINVTNAAAVEPSSPHALMKMLDNPLALVTDEDLSASLNNNPAAAQDQWALLWLADAPPQPIAGANIVPWRLTGTTTLVAGAWTLGQLVADEALPVGRYAVVGMHAMAAGLVAARLVFRGVEGGYRPGCLGVDVIADLADPIFRNGRLGVWGEFHTTQQPAVEYLSVSADTAETVVLDLIPLG